MKNDPVPTMDQPRSMQSPIGAITLLPRQAYEARYTAESDIIGFAFDSQTGDHAYAGDCVRPFLAVPNGLAFVPKGCDVYSRSTTGGEYLTLTLDSQDHTLAPVQFNDIKDLEAWRTAFTLRRWLLSNASPCILDIEYLANQLLRSVSGNLHYDKSQANEAKWMTLRRFQLIEEYIEEHIEQKITVSMLSSYLGLSEGFFARAFKHALGKPPHDFIIDRRVIRARSLLNKSSLSLADIAFATGFSSHAHMTSVFNTRLGIAPSYLRH